MYACREEDFCVKRHVSKQRRDRPVAVRLRNIEATASPAGKIVGPKFDTVPWIRPALASYLIQTTSKCFVPD